MTIDLIENSKEELTVAAYAAYTRRAQLKQEVKHLNGVIEKIAAELNRRNSTKPHYTEPVIGAELKKRCAAKNEANKV